MKRSEATGIIAAMLAAICTADRPRVLDLVTGIDVFGSYARGASLPHDVDINIECDRTATLQMFDVYEWMAGKATAAIKAALVGRSRKVHVNVDMRLELGRYPGVTLVPLWRTGDTLDCAMARLSAITEDAEAGRAPREYMLPQLEGLDEYIPVYLRERICTAVAGGAVRLERFTIPDRRVDAPAIARYLDRRWRPGGALNRLGHAMSAQFEQRDIDPGTVHLHGRDVRDTATPYFAGFSCRYLHLVPYYSTEYGAREYVEVPRPPTTTRPIEALRIICADAAWFTRTGVLLWDRF